MDNEGRPKSREGCESRTEGGLRSFRGLEAGKEVA
jgi:hypothetical protein